MFGGETSKQAKLYSNWKRTRRLHRTLDTSLCFDSTDVTRSYVDQDGRRRCCGGSRLKGTQSYPDGLGTEVARQLSRYGAHDIIETESEDTDSDDLSSDTEDSSKFEDWPEDMLEGVLEAVWGTELPSDFCA